MSPPVASLSVTTAVSIVLRICSSSAAVSSSSKSVIVYVSVVIAPGTHAPPSLQLLPQSITSVSSCRCASIARRRDAAEDVNSTTASGLTVRTTFVTAVSIAPSGMVPSSVIAVVSTTTSSVMVHAGTCPGASGAGGGNGSSRLLGVSTASIGHESKTAGSSHAAWASS